MSRIRLLFVCTANQCRSPMAEALAREIGGRRHLPMEARSAGVSAFPGTPAHAGAVAALAEVGIDLSPHRSRALSVEDVAWADHILVMEPSQLSVIEIWFGEAMKKTRLLGESVEGGVVEDPLLGGPAEFAACRDQLSKLIEQFLTSIRGT